MAKRYHDSREKMLESHDYYSGHKARMRMEREDGGMIHEDHSAVANMPQNVMMKPYPKKGGYLPEDLDDTMYMIDEQRDGDRSMTNRHLDPKKI